MLYVKSVIYCNLRVISTAEFALGTVAGLGISYKQILSGEMPRQGCGEDPMKMPRFQRLSPFPTALDRNYISKGPRFVGKIPASFSFAHLFFL